jgi:hypothetical protein
MRREPADALQLDEQGAVTLAELMERSGLAEEVLRELVACGALDPLEPEARAWTFTAHCVVVARTASRLQRDFELDPHALAVVLSFAERIDALEEELRRLRALLPR